MVQPPTPEAEDERRMCRERAELIEERVRRVNRIKGLLFSQGVRAYEPLRRDRRKRLDELRTGDGRAIEPHLKAQIERFRRRGPGGGIKVQSLDARRPNVRLVRRHAGSRKRARTSDRTPAPKDPAHGKNQLLTEPNPM